MRPFQKFQRWIRILKLTVSRWLRPRPQFSDHFIFQNGLLAPEQLRECQARGPFDETLRKLGVNDQRSAVQRRAFELGMPYVDVERVARDQAALDSVNADMARIHQILPLKRQDPTLWVAFGRPNDIRAIEALTEATGCRIIAVLAQPKELEAAIIRHYGIK